MKINTYSYHGSTFKTIKSEDQPSQYQEMIEQYLQEGGKITKVKTEEHESQMTGWGVFGGSDIKGDAWAQQTCNVEFKIFQDKGE